MKLVNGVPSVRGSQFLDIAVTSTITIAAGASTGTFTSPYLTSTSMVTFDVISDPGALISVQQNGAVTPATFGTVNGVYTATNGSVAFKVYGTSTAISTVLVSIHEPMNNASGGGTGPG
jgi:hypothetical protein